jgi:carboxypeptidase Taq
LERDASIGDVVSSELCTAVAQGSPGDHKRRTGHRVLLLWDQQTYIGGRYYPDELIERVTGGTLDTAPYLRYLKGKFGELYDL